MQDNKFTLNSQPLSISFSSSKSNGQNYRSISDSNSSSNSLQNGNYDNIPDTMTFVHRIKTPQNISFSMIECSLNADYPKSKAPLPLDFLVTPINIKNDNENSISSISSFSCTTPTSLLANTNKSSFQCYNELNSYLVENEDSLQVLNTLNNILSTKFNEIDFKIDYNNKCIDGLVFLSSYCVFFIIYIWPESHKHTRFEFRRTSGDALPSAKFWSQIKGYYQGENNNHDEFDLISLDLNVPTMQNNNENQNRLSKTQLNELRESLINNDLFIVDELNFIYESMMENELICFDILSNKYLMIQLINESLLNKDICVSRIVLLILAKLTKLQTDMCHDGDYNLFNNINFLLNHKRRLIKGYVIRLLSNLSATKQGWNINNVERIAMIQNIKKYQNECTNNLYHAMIQKINRKLY